jgi:hypothetical protein
LCLQVKNKLKLARAARQICGEIAAKIYKENCAGKNFAASSLQERRSGELKLF